MGRRAPSIRARCGASSPTKLKGPISSVDKAVNAALETISTSRGEGDVDADGAGDCCVRLSSPSQRCSVRMRRSEAAARRLTVRADSGVA